MMLSIVTPAYNEAENLPLLHQRLRDTLEPAGVDWEWIVVDDHSTDSTFGVLCSLAESDPRVRAWRFSRNFGSHAAIACGIQQAGGDCAVILAADLQDPPEVLPTLLEKWHTGVQIVWAKRASREGEKAANLGFSRLYYFIMRQIVGLKQIPPSGADFFLIDRVVMDAFNRFDEGNASLLALITWMGFVQETVAYDKQPRLHGKSGWSLGKKLKLVIDSVTSFSYLPIRLMSYLGFVIALLGFLYAGVVIVNGLAGRPPEGWASLMIAILVIGGMQMLMMGVLGEYLWRALDEARRRPRYLIEASVNSPAQPERRSHEAS